MMMKHLLHDVKTCLVVTVLLLAATTGKAQTPTGTAEDPIIISDAAGLKAIAQGLDKHYKLGKDITLTGAWTPIGLSSTTVTNSTVANFTGSFDGAGHLISGLTVEDGTCAGLFASNAGTIKNLGISTTGGITGQYAGGISGKNTNAGTITNCYTTGTFVSTKDAFSSAGGIVGQNDGKINSCYTTLEEIKLVGTSSYNYYVGGIAGENTSTGSIQHCLVLCKKIDMSNGGGIVYMDRIAGSQKDLSGSADNNTNFYGYNIEFIKFPNMSSNHPYGIPGLLWNGSFAEGSTSWKFDEAQENFYLQTTDGMQMETSFPVATYRYLIGEGTVDSPYEISTIDDFKRMSIRTNQNYSQETDKYYKLTQPVTISEEFLQISASRSFNGFFDGNGQTITITKLPNNQGNSSRAYGLFGAIGEKSEIKNLHADCTVDVDVSSEEVGYYPTMGVLLTKLNSSTEPVVNNCYVTGTLTFKTAKAFTIGGLAGTCSGGIIKNCYTDVNIKVSSTLGSNSNSYYAGGIAGNITNTGDIQNCYAKGKIEMDANGSLNAGGILGNYDGAAPKNCLALNPSITMTSTGDATKIRNSRISAKGYWFKYETTNNNYASLKMALSKNGTAYTPVPDTEEAGTNQAYKKYMEEDGTGWSGELPSDAWETADGYINLKSIRETFGLRQQIKLTDYVPFTITLPTTTYGTVTSAPEEKAFSGETIQLTITPNQGYRLIDNSLKAFKTGDETTVVTIEENKFTMPGHAVTITASFEIDSLRLGDITTGDSLLISETEDGWFYTVKAATSTAMLKSITLDTPYPFNGVISGTLADGKAIVFEPSCQGDLTFDDVTVPALVVKPGASIVLGTDSKLSYTALNNDGGTLVAREGASLNADGQAVDMNTLTITTPQNGTLTVKAANVTINSGDRIAQNTQFTVTATPAANYLAESVTVQGSTGTITPDTDGNYTMPDEAVTVSAVFKHDQPVVPPYVPAYYTVTLPAVEGVTTDPKAGDYTVEEGYSFRFALTLEAGYEQSAPVVKANGRTVTPRESDGKYVVKNIYEDTEITIEGITPDTPTDNAEIASGTEIFVRESVLHLRLGNPAKVTIANAAGQVVRHARLQAGENTVRDLRPGFYLVIVEGQAAVKVVIR